jgi:hypothetical protein
MRTDLEEFRLNTGEQVGGIAVNQALREQQIRDEPHVKVGSDRNPTGRQRRTSAGGSADLT